MSAVTRWLLAAILAPGLLIVVTAAVLSLVQGPSEGARQRPLRSAVTIDPARLDFETPGTARIADGSGRNIDPALRTIAIDLMPDNLTPGQVRRRLVNGLWSDAGDAVAVSVPRGDGALTFVFRRRPDGSYAGADVSWIAEDAFAFIGWPRAEYERFETEPVGWTSVGRDYLLLSVRTRAWHSGLRYTSTNTLSVAGDGSVGRR